MHTEALIDTALVRDLMQPENLPGSPAQVELRSTHGSTVFLTEDSAYKVKKAKDYGFFDYTDLAARRHFCDEEVRLNRRTAPTVYLGVLPVYRDATGHSMTREAEIVDWAVHMQRLPDARCASTLAENGTLGETEIREIAARAARFYREAPTHPPDPEALRISIEENFSQLQPFAGQLIDATVLAEVQRGQTAWLATRRDQLARRPCRDGHGDLRLEHVYLMPKGVQLIDCIEFLDRFRIADPALDAAFLAMDLHRVRRADLAESFLAHFAFERDDYDQYPLLDGYMSYRATVRAKVACFVASDTATASDVAARKKLEAEEYLTLARDLIAFRRPTPRLLAVGGIIGSGKTTAANEIATDLHLPVVSADATRKNLAGLAHDQRGGEELYTAEFTAQVLAEVLRRTDQVLTSGRSVLVDTTFATRSLRDRVRALATRHAASFTMIECAVAEAETRRRLRERSGGLSDARESLLDDFLDRWEPMDEPELAGRVRLDTSQPRQTQRAALVAAGILASRA